MISDFRRAATVLLLSAGALGAQAPTSLSDSALAKLSATLSEAQGYFDTDNLISNEDSYLHVVGTLKRLGVAGGAYLGVGPDQSFSYIAAIKPHIAFMIDIRRDNMLEHLMFKSMFAQSRNRLEYLCLLFGKAAPADTSGWGARDATALLAYIDAAPVNQITISAIQTRVLTRVKSEPFALTAGDLATIARFHSAFIAQGPALRFNSAGRPPASYDPDYRRLVLETDLTKRQSSFLAHEADFQTVKALEDRNLIVPVVGNLAGNKALAAIGDWLRSHGETVSAFYTSNVEQYLYQDGSFAAFARTTAQLPRNPRSVIIRSYFQGGHPLTVSGYHATQMLEYMDSLAALSAAGRISNYSQLIRDVIPP